MGQSVAFAQLTKIDVEKRLVYGRAAQETPDHSGEVMDYEQSKPNFMKWSDEMSKATNGASQGNLRSMHGNTAAGKIQELIYNDEECAIDVVAKVVDDNEWQKCLEGVYTGFSIGGKYGARVTKGDFKHYEAIPSEISLVDRPCIPTATFFDIQKADGSVMQKKFQTSEGATEMEYEVTGTPEDADNLAKLLATNKLSIADAVAAVTKSLASPPPDAVKIVDLVVAGYDKDTMLKLAGTDVDALDALEKLAPFADPVNNKYPIDTAAQVRAAWTYINMEKNASKYSAEALAELKKTIIAAWKDKVDSVGPEVSAAKAESTDGMTKGISTVSNLGDMLQALYYLAGSSAREAQSEGDSSDIPARLQAVVLTVAEIYKDMAGEEAAELVADFVNGDADSVAVMQMAYGLAGSLAKAGARNSAADQDMLQKMHDLATKLGANCATNNDAGAAAGSQSGVDREDSAAGNNTLALAGGDTNAAAVSGGHMAQAAATGALTKAETSPEEVLNKLVAAAIEPLQKALQAATDKITKLESQPLPAKGVLRVVSKGDDVETAVQKTLVAPVVERDGKVNDAATEFKKIHASGGAPLIGGARNVN